VLPRRIRTGPPDFVGVGTQRSGTTWWYRLLLDHPRIELPLNREQKEFHFFDKYCGRPMRDEEIARYHGWFARRRGVVCGEWTPRYMFDAWTPRLLARAAPDTRLLVLLRDPIERYRSGVAHQVTRVAWRGPAIMAHDALGRSCYGRQLRRILDVFDREQVLVLQYERCRADPIGQYARTLRFLGLPDDHVPAAVEELTGGSTAAAKEPLWPDLQESLMDLLEPETRLAAELAGDLDLSLWPHFAHLAERV
jgi:hypothetical protein